MRIETKRKSRLKNLCFSQVEGESKRETGIDDVLAVQSFRLKKTKPDPSSS